MNKLILSTIIAATMFSGLANADYVMHIPLEASMGGALPDGSIKFVAAPVEESGTPESPTSPEESPFNFAAYSGVGVFDWTQAGGDFQSESFQSTLYRKVLLRGYGFHSVWLNGDHSELGSKYSSMTITTQSGSFNCVKSGDASVMWTDYNDGNGTIIETVMHCEVSNYDYSATDLGQEFSVSFQ